MKVVKKVYIEFQTLFFVCIVFAWSWNTAPVRLVEDHEIPEMGIIVYNTTDGRQCILRAPYISTYEYYIVGRECDSYDRVFIDNLLILFLLTFAANALVSRRRIVEEMVDEETGDIRSILSSKRVYELREHIGIEIVEIYVGSYRVL